MIYFAMGKELLIKIKTTSKEKALAIARKESKKFRMKHIYTRKEFKKIEPDLRASMWGRRD